MVKPSTAFVALAFTFFLSAPSLAWKPSFWSWCKYLVLKDVRTGPGEKDFFQQHPPFQPKFDVANYVESRGIRVAKRFKNLKAAVKSGMPFIARSEHPDDYAGASGLIHSHSFFRSAREYEEWQAGSGGSFDSTDAKLLARYLEGQIDQKDFEAALKSASKREIHKYCLLIGVDEEFFASQVSYSYWALVPGLNRSIVADSAVPGRYHLFTVSPNLDYIYTLVENNRILWSEPTALDSGLQKGIPEVIKWYEKIRQLGRFDPSHPALVEFQTHPKGDHYFLQYLRTRDFLPASFRLDRNPEPDELVAQFVRGVTPPEGLTLAINRYDYFDSSLEVPLVPYEGAGVESTEFDAIKSELMTRRRVLQLVEFRRQRTFDTHHLRWSQLFKPQITAAVNLQPFLQSGGSTHALPTRVHIVSDGRKAYYRLLP